MISNTDKESCSIWVELLKEQEQQKTKKNSFSRYESNNQSGFSISIRIGYRRKLKKFPVFGFAKNGKEVKETFGISFCSGFVYYSFRRLNICSVDFYLW